MIFFVITIIILGFLISYMFYEAFQNNVREITVEFSTFPDSIDSFKMFFISDIHRRSIDDEIINKVKGEVDCIVIGGDLMEKGVPFSRVKANLQKLKEVGPIYFVWGNNDYEVDYHQLDALLLDYGVKILDNTAETLESAQGEKIIMIGVDDMTHMRDRVDLALLDADQDGFKILISHNPKIIQKITMEDDIKLILSGHTHGGQIRFLKWGLYEKGKLRKVDSTNILVSNGYGTTGLPLRLGAPSETHLITLKKCD
ncbi:metallophosphoesterase [Cytobacillus sp. IB215665]|uniref:metallophosphoesterase n=1 Tax=Cytobacillus sp. IB215665 TaxID=3097357 RepID=UPI002A15A739|nr:metallophosphoesterase [Cytobacillus sp. IB215665]MDX8364823.1 metallophosphoesterase family protein [Cytobacillus sp. IB215665]